MKIRKSNTSGNVPIDMTPMIDIVFQLLVFFVMTFKIATVEGDFNVKMPLSGSSAAPVDTTLVPPMRVKLEADATGNLSAIVLNDDQPLGSLNALTDKIIGIVGTNNGPDSAAAAAEVEFDCDYDLQYKYVISAISAVSGKMTNGALVKLVEKIKFTPPKRPGA